MSKSIDHCIYDNLNSYFDTLQGTAPHDLYNMIINAVEKPMLDVVMRQAQGNQSRAAQWLGMNRNTLRKKLLDHGLILAGSPTKR